MDVQDFVSRELDQEIDTIELIPDHPDFVIIGTYSLQKQEAEDKSSGEDHNPSALRKGSLQALPLRTDPTLAFTPTRYEVPYAVVDIHFHPCRKTLLGAATSVGLVVLFSIIAQHHDTDLDIASFEITRICSVEAGNSITSNPPLVTQFIWLSETDGSTPSEELRAGENVAFAACDSNGHSQIVQAQIPDIQPDTDQHLTSDIIEIHKQNYDLEAWCISNIRLYNHDTSTHQNIILSGGDDSSLIASLYDRDRDTLPPTFYPQRRLFTDKTTHAAGVVAILPLSSPTSPSASSMPILTGSYDETLRLFHLDPTTSRLRLHSSISVPGGGVWKIALLDTYILPNVTTQEESVTTHYILLISAMHAGARIVRLTHQTSPPAPQQDDLVSAAHQEPSDGSWHFSVEASFSQGHRSMVYACVAREVARGGWVVVSTSFYDKKVCDWEWVDELKRTRTREPDS